MSLINCKECDHQISKKAKTCPTCGAPNRQQTSGCAYIFVIIAGLMLSGYIAMLLESHPTTSRSTQAPTEKPLAAPTKKETIALSDDEYKDICRAAIAALYRKPLDIVKVNKKVGQVAYISYIRSSDGTTWRYKTKIENNNIVWGVTDGRWRTHKLDEALTYAYDSDRGLITIFVTYPDKSSSKWDYQI